MFNETKVDRESAQECLGTFHARFQQEKMKVMKADAEDQQFQQTSQIDSVGYFA